MGDALVFYFMPRCLVTVCQCHQFGLSAKTSKGFMLKKVSSIPLSFIIKMIIAIVNIINTVIIRQEAVDYMEANTALSRLATEREVKIVS